VANRNWNRKQALEKEIKEIYVKFTLGTPVAATASLATTTPVVMTHALAGSAANTGTVTLQVAPAAANPTDTVLAVWTGTAAAIVLTITPNDGTNNTATPVPLTTAELAEYIDTGAVVGKTITTTDASSLAAKIASATGGGAANLADGGEGDGLVATWSGGTDGTANNSIAGVSAVNRNAVGDYSIVLDDAYSQLKSCKAILLSSSAADIHAQIKSETVSTSTSKTVRVLLLTGSTLADPAAGVVVLCKLELKNSSVTA
jgi:hypothetical protein